MAHGVPLPPFGVAVAPPELPPLPLPPPLPDRAGGTQVLPSGCIWPISRDPGRGHDWPGGGGSFGGLHVLPSASSVPTTRLGKKHLLPGPKLAPMHERLVPRP